MEETSRLHHYALACTGVYIFSRKKWDTKWKFAHQIFNFFIAVCTFIFTTGFITFKASDVVVWIEGICIWLTGFNAHISVIVTLVFRKDFRIFLEEMVFQDAMLELPFVQHAMNSSNEGIHKELKFLVMDSQKKLFKYSRILLKSYSCAVVSTAALYICDALYKMVVRSDNSLRVFAFGMWFPWNTDVFNVYIASFIFHAYAGFFCAMVYPTVQSTVVLLMGQVIRQLRILTFILLHLDDLVLEITHERDAKWQMYCTAVFSQCVEHYVKIKRFSNRLNMICRSFYLAVILDAMLLVCVCSVKIAISNNKMSPDLIKYFMHEMFFILFVLLFCYLGQMTQNQCEHLERAVMEKWYIFDRKHKKNVLIFSMAVSQRIPIYIFGTITLSLPTFTWFIKTGMSFFTLAMSVLEE